MGARINKFGRQAWDIRQTPRIDWFLRYRVCKKYGHKGTPCSRCTLWDESLTGMVRAVMGEDMIPRIVHEIERPNPFYQFFKRRSRG